MFLSRTKICYIFAFGSCFAWHSIDSDEEPVTGHQSNIYQYFFFQILLVFSTTKIMFHLIGNRCKSLLCFFFRLFSHERNTHRANRKKKWKQFPSWSRPSKFIRERLFVFIRWSWPIRYTFSHTHTGYKSTRKNRQIKENHSQSDFSWNLLSSRELKINYDHFEWQIFNVHN